MSQLTPAALEHFVSHHGIASVSDLKRVGLSSHTIRGLVEGGILHQVLRGAYRLPSVPLDESARCAAVCIAHPEVVISGPTAGRIWGFRRLPSDSRIHVLGPPASRPTIANWVVPYRTRAFHDEDVQMRTDGILVTTRQRTALDLARTLTPTNLLSVVEQAMSDGHLTEDDMRRVAVDWISPQRPWLRSYLETLDHRLAGGAADSHYEVVLGDALARGGIPDLVRQFSIDLPGYGPARFDLAVPNLRWAIEIDVFPTHSETAGRQSDAWRDRSAMELGWLVDRVVEADFGRALDDTVRRLIHSYERRKAECR
jgi:hypothetical protein